LRNPEILLVSILVFLDGALKAGILSRVLGKPKCFNPCFSGWRSERGRGDMLMQIERVSILVFLDGALKAGKSQKLTVLHILFQSLFFWMAL